MKVIILCGGDGIRLKNMIEPIPKAMVMIGHRPMVWHVMKIFSKFGYNEFILALGIGGDKIRDYFINYNLLTNNITVELDKNNVIMDSQHQEKDWKITLVDTGENAGTGARIARCRDYIKDEDFFVTYCDCLSDVDISKVLEQHATLGKVATLTGIFPPFRYGEFILENNQPIEYNEISKLKGFAGAVNGGFMVFKNKIFDYLESFNECVLEGVVFKKLVQDREIDIYHHRGFWQCLDNDREYFILNELNDKNQQHWLF